MNVEELLSGARDAISVRRVFGDPIEHEGTMVVPVAKVGGGGGGGGDNEQNGGGGFGLGAKPVGAYVIKDGQVSWKPAIDPVRVAFLAVVAFALLLRAGRR
jgi:uncharacterized spore protein YtfJ